MSDPTPPVLIRRWHQEKQGGHEYSAKSPGKTRSIFFAVAGLLALAGGLSGLLSWLTPVPRPTLVALSIGQYQTPAIPFPSQVSQDLQALVANGLFHKVVQPSSIGAEKHTLVGELTALKDHPAQTPVVFYLSGNAWRDKGGDVMVLAGNSDPDVRNTALPLRTVLKSLADCPARHKLLVLDIMRPLADARLGVLMDDVAEGIPQELDAVPDEQRLVLCACSPGQVSLTSQAAGRSIFSFYFEEGLRGWADGHGAHGSRDGWVTVKELAAFVQARVDRWAHVNRDLRQTPVLYGDGADFNLASFDTREAPGHVAEAAPANYPDPLKEAWKQQDQELAFGNWRLTPRNQSQQSAWLLKAERDWRGGLATAALQGQYLAGVRQLRTQAAKSRVLPLPEPQSLALALVFGDKDDKEATKGLQEFILRLHNMKAADPARAKLTEEFTEKFAKFSPVARASAVLQQAGLEIKPAPDRIVFLDSLVESDADKRPRFVETLQLKRLAEMAAQKNVKQWSAEAVRQMLQVALRGEAAASRFDVHSWSASLLEEADSLRHDGEVLFWASGYGSLAEADQLLAQAAARYTLAQRRGEIVIKARQSLDDALLFLPAYASYLEHQPDMLAQWLDAVNTAQRLGELLNPSADQPKDELPKIDGIQDATELLQRQLTPLRQPLEADFAAGLVRRAKQAKADSNTVHEIHAVLGLPFLKADDRVALWQAGYDLEQRLHQQTIRLDREEDEAQTPMEPLEAADRQQVLQFQKDQAVRRATVAIAELEWAGLPPIQIDALRQQLEESRKQGSSVHLLRALGETLGQAWAKQLPAQFGPAISPQAQDQLSRLLPPLESLAAADDIPLSLPTQLLAREAKGLWTRLGMRYRFQSTDYRNAGLDWSPVSSGERFFAQAALAYAPEPMHLPEVSMAEPAPLPRLSAQHNSTECPLELEWITAKPDKDTIKARVRNPDPLWLAIEPGIAVIRGRAVEPALPLALTSTLNLDVRLVGAGEMQRGSPPKGFLVQADLEGRHFHFKVPVPIQTAPDQPYLFLSSAKESPKSVLNEIRLRPGKARQTVYLYARNPGDKPRKVAIEIKTGDSVVKGGTITKVLPPQSTQRIDLGDPAPLPPADLPGITGPLSWRVFDPERNNDLLDEQSIPVTITTPRDYVRVMHILFSPATPETTRNRLVVRAQVYAPPGGPDIPVELVLPADRIPGLLGVGKGTLRGEMAADGDKDRSSLQLDAEKIMLAQGEEEEGIVFLNIDGFDRAFVFRTVFARTGAPTTPRVELRPAVRVRGDRFVRPNPKFALPIEVDNAPDGATLEVTVGQLIAGEFRPGLPAKLHPTAKRNQMGFSPQSPDGGLVFEGILQDWVEPLDTSKLLGKHDVQVRLLDSTGKVIARTMHTFVVVDNAPQGAQIVGAPKVAKLGSKIVLQASASDPDAGIKEAVFFIGKAIDNKLPPNATPIPGKPFDSAKSFWQAEVHLPDDRKGPVQVSVQFINQVGLSSFATATIELVDTDPAKTGPGKIKGKVMLGELPQPDLMVQLKDPKGAEKATTKTKSDGTFVFENVPPGRYSVYSRKNEVQRHGTANAVVEPNKDTEVTVNLTLRVTK